MGVAVTVQKALTPPVVYNCCQVLSQTVGTLPWGIFERKSGGSKARRDQHPLPTLITRAKSRTMA